MDSYNQNRLTKIFILENSNKRITATWSYWLVPNVGDNMDQIVEIGTRIVSEISENLYSSKSLVTMASSCLIHRIMISLVILIKINLHLAPQSRQSWLFLFGVISPPFRIILCYFFFLFHNVSLPHIHFTAY